MNVVARETLQRLAEIIHERDELERRMCTTLAALLRQSCRILRDPNARYTDRQNAIIQLDMVAKMLERQAREPQPEEETSG